MRRVSIDEAFAGQTVAPGIIAADGEALVLEVHGGRVQIIVPVGTADAAAVGQARLVQGELHLENERVLTFQVTADATGASYRDAPIAAEERREGDAVGARARPADTRAATAADIMTREVLTVGPAVAVKELANRLAYHRISGMPVVDEQGTVLGVVSEADLISKRGKVVGDIMTSPVISVTEETPAIEVAMLLTEERIKRVPVLRDGRLVGLIGRSNVVSWVGSQGPG